MKTQKIRNDLKVIVDYDPAGLISIMPPWTSTLYLTKEEVEWLSAALSELLKPETLLQEMGCTSLPPDEL